MDHDAATRSGATERYLLGEMGDQERAAFEEHLFGCELCGADVRAADRFLEGARAALAEHRATAPARAPWWRRLLGTGGPWPTSARLSLAAACGLLLVAGYQRWELRQPRAVAGFVLRPAARADEAPAIAPAPRIVLVLEAPAPPAPSYTVELRRVGGPVVRSFSAAATADSPELYIELSGNNLPPGPYVLTVRDPRGAGRTLDHPFRLQPLNDARSK